jgi:hypothetical protein
MSGLLSAVKLVAVVGTVWSICLGLLGLLVPLSKGRIDTSGLLITVIVLVVCWRLHVLRRWAAVTVCLYSWSMVLSSLVSGIWLWTVVWLLFASLNSLLVLIVWEGLDPGL